MLCLTGILAVQPTHLQTRGASTPGARSLTVNISASAAGSVLLVGISASGGTVTSVGDNRSDVFTRAVGTTVAGQVFAIYYTAAIAGVTAVTASFPFGSADLIVAEYAGVGALDRTAFRDNGYRSGTAYSSGNSAATSQSSELAWAFSGNAYDYITTWTAGTGWTGRATQGYSFVQEKVLTSAGVCAASGTIRKIGTYRIVSLLVTLRAGSGSPPPAPDTTAPQVAITSPAPGASLSGSVAVSAGASDNVAVASVQFQLDGANLGTALTTPPYNLAWDTRQASDGSHTLRALATDSSGNTAAAAVTATVSNSAPSGNGVSIILDDDVAADVDDVGDHALLWALARRGEANVLALVTSSTNEHSAPAVWAIANFYGHPEVPIGAWRGASPAGYDASFSYFTQEVAARFGRPGETRAGYPDAVAVYRRALAGAADGSVYIVAGGFYEPLRALLESAADSASPLTGAQLVARKVRALVPAAGWFPDSGDNASFNFRWTPDAASYVFANWPGPIVAVGSEVGYDVLTGPAAGANPDTNPVKLAYNLYCHDGYYCPNAQYAWTQVAILYAVRGAGSTFYSAGENGATEVWNAAQAVPGRNLWSPGPNRQHSYIERRVGAAELQSTINTLIQSGP